jgi:hypothetical protein
MHRRGLFCGTGGLMVLQIAEWRGKFARQWNAKFQRTSLAIADTASMAF